MSQGRNYTAGERAVALLGVLAGKTDEEIQEVLTKDQTRTGATLREVSSNSLAMLRRSYLPKLFPGVSGDQERWEIAWGHITNPKTLGDLSRDESV